jgi:sulfur carrier protein
MNILVNGEKRENRKGKTLAGLVKNFNPSNKRVAVLLNDDLIPRDRQAAQLLKEGDRVEILTFAGGG